LLIRGRLIGLSREEFWDLTLRELIREFVVHRRRQMERHDDEMSIAWTTAALMRQEKLPKLEKLLIRKQQMRQQTPAEQRAAMQTLAASMGTTLKKVRLVRMEPKV
jgi:hypothetical protein